MNNNDNGKIARESLHPQINQKDIFMEIKVRRLSGLVLELEGPGVSSCSHKAARASIRQARCGLRSSFGPFRLLL